MSDLTQSKEREHPCPRCHNDRPTYVLKCPCCGASTLRYYILIVTGFTALSIAAVGLAKLVENFLAP